MSNIIISFYHISRMRYINTQLQITETIFYIDNRHLGVVLVTYHSIYLGISKYEHKFAKADIT